MSNILRYFVGSVLIGAGWVISVVGAESGVGVAAVFCIIACLIIIISDFMHNL